MTDTAQEKEPAKTPPASHQWAWWGGVILAVLCQFGYHIPSLAWRLVGYPNMAEESAHAMAAPTPAPTVAPLTFDNIGGAVVCDPSDHDPYGRTICYRVTPIPSPSPRYAVPGLR